MKIAICTDMYAPQLGGVADSVLLQARGLRALGHDVHIFAAHMRGETPDPEVTRFRSVELFGGTFCIVSPFGIRGAILEYKPDVVHAHSFGTIGLVARYTAKKHTIPSVATIHGSPVDYLHYFGIDLKPFRYLALRFVAWFFSGFTVVTAVSSQSMDLLLHAGLRRVRTTVISNAVDDRLFRHVEDKQDLRERIGIDHKAVLVFGRLAKEKNLDAALTIFADVHKRTNASLVIVGDGPERDHLELRARTLGIAEHTFFMGRLSGENLVSTINACSVMLITSRTEAQPMTILQANLCGVPVVGARAGGIPESINDEVTGYVVDGDDHGAFSDRISRLLSDTELNASMSAEAIAFARHHEPAGVALTWERLYRTLPGVL
jgi:1,2-diacylglycerol 3-alpha-glucosyltransferase